MEGRRWRAARKLLPLKNMEEEKKNMEGRRWRAARKLGTNLIGLVASNIPSDYLVAISVLHRNLSQLHLIGILHSLSLASCLHCLISPEFGFKGRRTSCVLHCNCIGSPLAWNIQSDQLCNLNNL